MDFSLLQETVPFHSYNSVGFFSFTLFERGLFIPPQLLLFPLLFVTAAVFPLITFYHPAVMRRIMSWRAVLPLPLFCRDTHGGDNEPALLQ